MATAVAAVVRATPAYTAGRLPSRRNDFRENISREFSRCSPRFPLPVGVR